VTCVGTEAMTDKEFERHMDRLDTRQAAITVGPTAALVAAVLGLCVYGITGSEVGAVVTLATGQIVLTAVMAEMLIRQVRNERNLP
jgi:hypothetical protein